MVNRIYIFTVLSIISLSVQGMSGTLENTEKQNKLNWELHQAIYRKNIVDLQEALQKGADSNAFVNGWPMLMNTVSIGSSPVAVDMAKILLAAGADINALNDDNMSMLHKAIEYDHVHLVKCFIQTGVDINAQALLEKGRDKTALLYAIGQGKFYASELVSPYCTEKHTTKINIEKNIEIIKALLKAGADLDRTDYNDMMAVDYAEDNDTIKKLLQKELYIRTRATRMHWFCMGKADIQSNLYQKLPAEIIQLIHKHLKALEEAEVS